MQTIEDVFRVYEINNPREWLESFRNAESSRDNSDWSDILGCEEFEKIFQGRETELLAECVPLLSVDDVFDNNTFTEWIQLLIKSLDRNAVDVYEGVAKLLIVGKKMNPPIIIAVEDQKWSDGEIYPANIQHVLWAMQASWDYGSDIERKYRARDRLCDAADQILKRRGL